jgi:hypothetical protein
LRAGRGFDLNPGDVNESGGGTLMRFLAVTVAAIVLAASQAIAQGTTGDGANPRVWSYSASLFGYFVPDDRDYAQPTFAADHGRLHLEARYNYEALKTGSAWLGYAFGAGRRLRMDITPMLGGVVGDLRGTAAGCQLTLAWSKLELDSESEYFFAFEDDSEDFFYNWSELSVTPADAWRVGLAVQRTRAYETGLDFQRGLLAGMSYKQVDLTVHVFNLGWEEPTVVISAERSF